MKTACHLRLKRRRRGCYRIRGILPWWSLTCSSEEGLRSAETESSSCEPLQCDDMYRLTPDKLCRKAIYGQVSIQSEATFDGKSCEFDARKLFNAAKCFFESLYKIKVLKTPLEERQIYDPRRQMNFTTIKMEMYFEDVDYMEEHYKVVDSMLTSYSTAMSIFSSHYCSINGGLKKREDKNLTQTSLPAVIEKNKIFPSIDGQTSPSNTSFRSVRFGYCLDIFAVEDLTFTHSACAISSETPRDTDDVAKRREFVSKVKSLQCLRDETLEVAAKGLTLRLQISGLLVYAMMILFLDTITD
ncbi:hypothetical protein ElyMa_002285400 [Elysia marginata]|uniref:Uncharacterized protein n=1 Tax=Elysia marginata TaxID=1093978 RepID=A0AAV4G3Y6_9GAST|nr:hypothetical protein ElyMa_002285400 [Elysia marginata]